MRLALRSLALLCSLALPVTALADGLTTYNIQGALQKGGSASGTFAVAPSGQVADENITVTDLGGTYQFGGFRAGGTNPGLYEYFADTKPNSDPDLLLLAFPQTNLIGYAGGSLCSTSLVCASSQSGTGSVSGLTLSLGYSDDPNFKSASDSFTSLTASLSSVPEPDTLALAGTGLLAVAGTVRRRRR